MIDEKQVLRYLGFPHPPPGDRIYEKVRRAIQEVEAAMRPKHIYRLFLIKRDCNGRLLLAEACMPLPGDSMAAHLAGCGRAIVLAATLGDAADRLLRLWQLQDMEMAVVIDACLTAAIEGYADEVQEGLAGQYGPLTPRFSPGYGDFPLEVQRELLHCLDATRRIGLTLTQSLLMVPTKSITAVMGLANACEQEKKNSCESCNLRNSCAFKREADTHES